jgi:hypothetical protein
LCIIDRIFGDADVVAARRRARTAG